MTSLQTHIPAIRATEEDRGAFVVRVYQHIFAGIVAFIAFEALLFTTGVAEGIYNMVSGNGMTWLLILGAFTVGQWFVNNAVSNLADASRQYAGLFGSAAMYALIFAYPMHIVYRVQNSDSTVLAAAGVTLVGFAMLTAVAFFTRKDLSFLRPIVMWGMGSALLLIVASVLMGWHLGVWFSVAMVAISGAAILYQTQAIIRNYPTTAHVAGAVHLFGSLMTMFYYVLRIFMSRD